MRLFSSEVLLRSDNLASRTRRELFAYDYFVPKYTGEYYLQDTFYALDYCDIGVPTLLLGTSKMWFGFYDGRYPGRVLKEVSGELGVPGSVVDIRLPDGDVGQSTGSLGGWDPSLWFNSVDPEGNPAGVHGGLIVYSHYCGSRTYVDALCFQKKPFLREEFAIVGGVTPISENEYAVNPSLTYEGAYYKRNLEKDTYIDLS